MNFVRNIKRSDILITSLFYFLGNIFLPIHQVGDYAIREYIEDVISEKISESEIFVNFSTQRDLIREEISVIRRDIRSLREKIADESEHNKELDKFYKQRIEILENEILELKENL